MSEKHNLILFKGYLGTDSLRYVELTTPYESNNILILPTDLPYPTRIVVRRGGRYDWLVHDVGYCQSYISLDDGRRYITGLAIAKKDDEPMPDGIDLLIWYNKRADDLCYILRRHDMDELSQLIGVVNEDDSFDFEATQRLVRQILPKDAHEAVANIKTRALKKLYEEHQDISKLSNSAIKEQLLDVECKTSKSEIVHCKDCKHWPYQLLPYSENTTADPTYPHCFDFKSNGYCSLGKRKEK